MGLRLIPVRCAGVVVAAAVGGPVFDRHSNVLLEHDRIEDVEPTEILVVLSLY